MELWLPPGLANRRHAMQHSEMPARRTPPPLPFKDDLNLYWQTALA